MPPKRKPLRKATNPTPAHARAEVTLADLKKRRKKLDGESHPYEKWLQFVDEKNNSANPVITPSEIRQHDITTHGKEHHIFPKVTYFNPKNHWGDKNCKYGKFKDGTTTRCLRNPIHKAVDNPDRRKQNGNQYTKKVVPKKRAAQVRASNIPRYATRSSTKK